MEFTDLPRSSPMSGTQSSGVKVAANAVIQSLPDNVSWDDVQYHLYVRQQIEMGLVDSAEGRVVDTNEMRRRLDERKKANLGK